MLLRAAEFDTTTHRSSGSREGEQLNIRSFDIVLRQTLGSYRVNTAIELWLLVGVFVAEGLLLTTIKQDDGLGKLAYSNTAYYISDMISLISFEKIQCPFSHL